MSGSLLLDTCAAIWIATDASIAEEAIEALDQASDRGDTVHLSPMTAWEIGVLAAHGRLASPLDPRAFFRQLASVPNMSVADLSPEVLIQSSFLPGNPPKDPVDRIIIATAREADMIVVTRDRLILDYAKAGHVRALGC